MEERLRGPDVRALAHEGGRQAHGQLLGKREPVEVKLGENRLTRQLAGEHRQLMTRLFEIPFQRRQGCPCLGQLRPLGQNIGQGDAAELKPAFDHRKLFFLQSHNLPGRPDL